MKYYITEIDFMDSVYRNIIRVSNGRQDWIPEAMDNTDYREYLEWVAEGNEAEPWDSSTPLVEE